MRPTCVLAVALLALIPVRASGGASPQAIEFRNADFEAGSVGSVPTAWEDLLASVCSATVTVSHERPHHGRACVEIRHDANPRTGMTGKVYIIQTFAASRLRGHRVELSGWLRCEPPGAVVWPVSAHLWMYAFGNPDATVDLGSHPVRSAEWTFARTACDVPMDSDSLALGAYLDCAGRAWIDDLHLVDCGPVGEGDQTARPLGYVRHPSDEAAAADWDAFTIAGVDAVEGARTDDELVTRLAQVFGPVVARLDAATAAARSRDPAPRGRPHHRLVASRVADAGALPHGAPRHRPDRRARRLGARARQRGERGSRRRSVGVGAADALPG